MRMIPIVTEESVFAVHGGSAINLFVRNLPRYSVDLDLTYIPLEDRNLSLTHINEHLSSVARKAKKALRGIHIVEKPDICKLRGTTQLPPRRLACLNTHTIVMLLQDPPGKNRAVHYASYVLSPHYCE